MTARRLRGVVRLTALEASFLAMETEVQALHVGSLLVLDGPAPTPAQVRGFVGAALAQVPAARLVIRRMPGGLGRPVLVDGGPVDVDAHLRWERVSAGDAGPLRELVARLSAEPMRRDRPLWDLTCVNGLPDGQWAVIVRAHHTLVDGASGVSLLAALLDRDVPEPGGVPGGSGAATPVGSDRSLPAAVFGAWLGALPGRTAGALADVVVRPAETRERLRLVRRGVATVAQPDLPRSVLGGPLDGRRRWGWVTFDVADVAAARAATGATLNDVFLAALAGGYRAYLAGHGMPTGTVRVLVPVSRHAAGPRAGRGTRVSAFFVRLPVGVADPAARLAAVVAATREQKAADVAAGTEALLAAADHVPAPLLERAARRYARAGQGRVNAVASDVPGLAAESRLMGRPIRLLAPVLPIALEVRTTAGLVTHGGRATIGITGDAAAFPDLDRLVAAVDAALHDLAASAPAVAGAASASRGGRDGDR